MKKMMYSVTLFSVALVFYCPSVFGQNALTDEWKGTSLALKPYWSISRYSFDKNGQFDPEAKPQFNIHGASAQITHRFTPNVDLSLNFAAIQRGLGGDVSLGYTKRFETLANIGVRTQAHQQFGYDPISFSFQNRRDMDVAIYKDWNFHLGNKFTVTPMIGVNAFRRGATTERLKSFDPKTEQWTTHALNRSATSSIQAFGNLNLEYKFSNKVSVYTNIPIILPIKGDRYIPSFHGKNLGGVRVKF